ncbi:hypothetical protein FOA52_013303 [Chlamydomonas sp. UWO 241]|nr:hypothetical protein FOA52_013303 [Chlamydomonas sp. UWO 241]
MAVVALWGIALHPENIGIIAAAGAIPSLVQLLASGSPPDVLKCAFGLLQKLSSANAEIAAAIAAAGAIPPLVQLLGPSSAPEVQRWEAHTLTVLAGMHAVGFAAFTSVGGMSALERPEFGSDDSTEQSALMALATFRRCSVAANLAAAAAARP